MPRAQTILLVILFVAASLFGGCASEGPPHNAIIIYGDTRTGHEIHRSIADELTAIQPKAVFHTGDLVEDGNKQELWDIFNDITSELRSVSPFYPALGNHENNSILYYNNFELPNNERWYSVDIDAIHFIILDSNADMSSGSAQYEWLVDDLQNIDGSIEFTIAIFHHPVFNVGLHTADQKNLMKDVVPLFESNGVDAVFSGHDHNYQRFFYNNIYYIISGGGGAPLYSQTRTDPYNQRFVKTYHFCTIQRSDTSLMIRVFSENLDTVDQFMIER